jgi:hypothetical protein
MMTSPASLAKGVPNVLQRRQFNRHALPGEIKNIVKPNP